MDHSMHYSGRVALAMPPPKGFPLEYAGKIAPPNHDVLEVMLVRNSRDTRHPRERETDRHQKLLSFYGNGAGPKEVYCKGETIRIKGENRSSLEHTFRAVSEFGSISQVHFLYVDERKNMSMRVGVSASIPDYDVQSSYSLQSQEDAKKVKDWGIVASVDVSPICGEFGSDHAEFLAMGSQYLLTNAPQGEGVFLASVSNNRKLSTPKILNGERPIEIQTILRVLEEMRGRGS